MAQTRDEPGEPADVIRAMAHPRRRDIVETLATTDTAPKPATVVDHHVHVPLLDDCDVIDVDGETIERGAYFASAKRVTTRVSGVDE